MLHMCTARWGISSLNGGPPSNNPIARQVLGAVRPVALRPSQGGSA